MALASVHRIPLTEIARADDIDFIPISENERKVIRIRVSGALVHASTAAVFNQFYEVLVGRHTRVGDLEQPVFVLALKASRSVRFHMLNQPLPFPRCFGQPTLKLILLSPGQITSG